jgi:hypothetical protein
MKSFFAGKVFSESETFVGISGTLTGPDMAYANNSYIIACYRDQGECKVSGIEQIGHNQIGSMSPPFTYPIAKWTPGEVVAKDQAGPVAKAFRCVDTTITIERQRKSVLWVEEPVNQTDPFCKNANTTIKKYTIEDSPGWKRLSGRH